MTLFRPTDLHQRLQELGKKPSRGLSQNFLIDGNILQKIVKAADVKKDDIILEIGPGPGALTQVLLQTGAHVIAVEMDAVFAEGLHALQTEDHRLSVVSGDFLEIALDKILPQNKTGIKVVANLPYHITTPIITRIINRHPQIESLTLMVQKEVGTRFIGQKRTSDYGSFTLFLQHYSDVSYCFTVEPTCFFPVPKVKSAVVQLILKEAPATSYPEKLIRTAFQQRRKMLRASLKELFSSEKIEQALKNLHLNPLARPEELSLNDFIDLQALLIL